VELQKKKLQAETGAIINIPKPGQVEEILVIKGKTESSILSAKARIELIRDSSISSISYTHFLSIPLNTPEIQKKLEAFFTDVGKQYGTAKGFDPSIQVKPTQFHLTILMLKLYSEELVRKAERILKEVSHKIYDILGSRSLLVNLKGLDYMNDDPTQVDVVYMNVQESDNGTRLEQVYNYLKETFKKRKFN